MKGGLEVGLQQPDEVGLLHALAAVDVAQLELLYKSKDVNLEQGLREAPQKQCR